MKKHIAILFLFLAYAILFCHNIVPHHHHDSENYLSVNHLDHCGEDNKDPSHLFCLYIHSSDSFTTANHHKIANTFSKHWISIVADLPGSFTLGAQALTRLPKPPPARHLLIISTHSLFSGLRAPPALIM